ncbi:MAG: rod shape-determining protein MreC [Novosphingobium sp.]|nr:rod shape-determining protein MreC [Novosphingobium sp.]
MAPSSIRRSGHSRRAQYRTFFGYLAGVAGFVLGSGLLILSIFQPQILSGIRGIAADAAEPPGTAVASGRAAGQNTFSTVAGYIKAARNYGKLERELAEAKTRIAEADATADENRRLKRLLGLAQNGPEPVAVTRFTSSTATSTRRFAAIGAGRNDGVAPGMPVRSVRGLVGRVLQAGTSSAKVLLVTDTESLVPVRRAKDGIAAFAQGRGDGTVQVRLINLGVNPIKQGDVFVTSGSGGLYRPGTAIAIAERIISDGAIAAVLSDPAATEYVIVEPVWAPEANPASEDELPGSTD